MRYEQTIFLRKNYRRDLKTRLILAYRLRTSGAGNRVNRILAVCANNAIDLVCGVVGRLQPTTSSA